MAGKTSMSGNHIMLVLPEHPTPTVAEDMSIRKLSKNEWEIYRRAEGEEPLWINRITKEKMPHFKLLEKLKSMKPVNTNVKCKGKK